MCVCVCVCVCVHVSVCDVVCIYAYIATHIYTYTMFTNVPRCEHASDTGTSGAIPATCDVIIIIHIMYAHMILTPGIL